MNMRDFFLKNKKLFHDHNQEFLQIFHVALSSYWDIYTGFDVVGFDDFMKVPEEKSLSEWIVIQHGERANELIKLLIGYEETENG